MATTYGTLRVIAGAGAGRVVKLQKLVTVVGSGKDADLQIVGEKVSESHASIEAGADGTCVLRNRSPFGTLVNKTRVDVHRLADGDRIQVGVAALVEFQAGAAAASGGRGLAGGSQAKKILIGAGIAVYLAGMVALALALQDMSTAPDGIPEADLERALADTRTALTAPPAAAAERAAATPVDPADPAAAYYRVVAARASGADPATVAREADALVGELRGRLRDGSALERQQRWLEARKAYREVLEMLPDLRMPAATLAAGRLSATAAELPEEE